MSMNLGSVSCWMGKVHEKLESLCSEALPDQQQLIAAGESIKHFCIQLKEDLFSCSRVKPECVNISSDGESVVEILVPEFGEENQEVAASAGISDVSSTSSPLFGNPEYISFDPSAARIYGSWSYDSNETESESYIFENPEYIAYDPSAAHIYGIQSQVFMIDWTKSPDLNMLPNLGTQGSDASSECELNIDLSFLDSDHESDIDQELQSDSDEVCQVNEDTLMGSSSISSPTHLREDPANYEVESHSGETNQENAQDNEWEIVDADWEIVAAEN